MTNGHPVVMSPGRRDHHQERNNGVTHAAATAAAAAVPASEKIHEKLSGESPPASMVVKFMHEPDLRIYDSENRAQDTYFNPVILSQDPLTDQEIEEQERLVQRLIREKEMGKGLPQQQQHPHSSAPAHAKDSNTGNISRRPVAASPIPSGSGNQLARNSQQLQQHSNPEISRLKEVGERRRRSNNNAQQKSNSKQQQQHQASVRGPASLHPIVTMHDSMKSTLSQHQPHHQVHLTSPGDAHGNPAGAALLHPNTRTDGIRNHRSPQQQSSFPTQHQQLTEQEMQSSGIGVTGETDLSQQSINPSIKTIAASGKSGVDSGGRIFNSQFSARISA